MDIANVPLVVSVALVALFIGAGSGALLTFMVMRAGEKQRTLELQKNLEKLALENQSLKEKLEWVQKSEAQIKESFSAIASEVLRQNSDELIKRSKEQIESVLGEARGDWKTQKSEIAGLVNPLGEYLRHLDRVVRELEQKREGAYQSLEEQLRQLSQTQAQLQSTTISLSQALRSSSTRGRWGELQLRRVVELAGMVEHVSYETQVSGDSGRPDMVVHLPNGGALPIDAKAPLKAYLDSFEAEDERARRELLQAHARALKNRIDELSRKAYWDMFEESPDYVVMFVPNEACLNAAFEFAPRLFDYAIEKQVLITTPVTLLALLRAAAYGWQQTQLAENARSIAQRGKELHERLVKFIEHLSDLRKGLNQAVESYNRAVGSLEHRVLPAAQRMQELGGYSGSLTPPDPMDQMTRLPPQVDEG